MKTSILTAAALACLVTAWPAAAQFARRDDAIKYRKAAFSVMAVHMWRIGAMVNGKIPFDARAAAENAAIATTMSKLPYTAFGEGTDKGDTRATPQVWSEGDKFHAATAKMQDEMSKLNAAAKTGDFAAIKTAFGAVTQSCKACHDQFLRE